MADTEGSSNYIIAEAQLLAQKVRLLADLIIDQGGCLTLDHKLPGQKRKGQAIEISR